MSLRGCFSTEKPLPYYFNYSKRLKLLLYLGEEDPVERVRGACPSRHPHVDHCSKRKVIRGVEPCRFHA
jgi:hypothetical protein